MIKKVLVTGSSGTIGTRLCEKLLENNFNITGVDINKNKWNKKINELTIIGDLRDKNIIKKLPKDADIIIHLAANARVYNLVKNPDNAFDNIAMLFNILEYTRVNKIKRFMFASSREVYGNSSKDIHREQDVNIDQCESPYTASKISGEALVTAYQKCYDIDFMILRFSNVYGMYDESDRVIPLFIRKCLDGEELTVFGDDKMLDFTYIDDTVDGIILCIEKFEHHKNNVFNIANGKGQTILYVAQLIKKFLSSDVNISMQPTRIGEVMRYIADLSKAKEKLDYNPKVDLVAGINSSIKWYKSNILELEPKIKI